MAVTFIPCLQHLAAVRLSLTVYEDDITDLFDELILSDKVDKDNSFLIDTSLERWIRKRKNKAKKKLSKFLPKLLQNHIANIFQPLVTEIYYWARDHFIVVKYIEKVYFTNDLCWKYDGTIDRIKTAKKLMQNVSIDKRLRFIIACIYFQESDVLHLWGNMTAAERKSICRINSYIVVRFWLKRLRKNVRFSWNQCATVYFDFIVRREIIYRDFMIKKSRIRLSSFFNELNNFNKRHFFHYLWPQHAHIDDLRLCYYIVDEIERAESTYFRSYSRDVLCCYLDWPLQSLFLDVVSEMATNLTPSCFEHLLHYIVDKKIMPGMQDFDYIQLLKELWKQIPDYIKKEIQKERIFTLVYAAMSYDRETHPLPIEELLKECRNFTDALPLRFWY